MAKSCLFVPVIDTMMIRITAQKAAITKIEMMILKGKWGGEVPIFSMDKIL